MSVIFIVFANAFSLKLGHAFMAFAEFAIIAANLDFAVNMTDSVAKLLAHDVNFAYENGSISSYESFKTVVRKRDKNVLPQDNAVVFFFKKLFEVLCINAIFYNKPSSLKQ